MQRMATCLSFLRVPDILQTFRWYEEIGFKCLGTHQEPGCDLDWALLDWDGAHFMLYPDGDRDATSQKDAGLYFTVPAVDTIIEVVKQKAEIIEITSATEYGMKEIVFRDINGFQVTFGCEVDPLQK